MFSRRWSSCALFLLSVGAVQAQTVDDGVMMPKKSLCTGFMYSHDQWDHYWEGTLERTNGNVGTVTTKSVAWMGTYGLTNDLNVIAMLPYVSTNASMGTLQSKSGIQDLTLAAKYRVRQFGAAEGTKFNVIAVGAYGLPATNYDPDILPMSIGLGAQRLSGRLTFNAATRPGWFGTATSSYTWRKNVTLDRPSYYTDGQLFLSDQVSMPDVFDYTLSAGYRKHRLYLPISFTQQVTRGGGDIRRQDMPFVSNTMNFSRLDAFAMYAIDKPGNLQVKLEAARILSGRNVGHSTTVVAGLFYTFKFSK